MRLTPRIFLWLLRRSVFAAFDDGCLAIAKGAAYSALLSFFPVLASAATILVQTRAEFVSRILEDSLDQIVPPGTEDLVMQQFRVTGARPVSLLIVAGIISIWAASGVIKSLMEGFQAIYRIPRSRGFLQTQGVSIAMVLLAAFPLVCATVVVIFGAQVESTVLSWMKVDPLLTPLSVLTQDCQPRSALPAGISDYGFGHLHVVSIRSVPQTALALRVAGRGAGDDFLVAGHGGIRVVCAQYRPLQRDVRVGRGGHRAAGVDVPDGRDRADRVRV